MFRITKKETITPTVMPGRVNFTTDQEGVLQVEHREQEVNLAFVLTQVTTGLSPIGWAHVLI